MTLKNGVVVQFKHDTDAALRIAPVSACERGCHRNPILFHMKIDQEITHCGNELLLEVFAVFALAVGTVGKRIMDDVVQAENFDDVDRPVAEMHVAIKNSNLPCTLLLCQLGSHDQKIECAKASAAGLAGVVCSRGRTEGERFVLVGMQRGRGHRTTHPRQGRGNLGIAVAEAVFNLAIKYIINISVIMDEFQLFAGTRGKGLHRERESKGAPACKHLCRLLRGGTE